MLLLRKVIDKKHIWIASVFGAILHNIGQIVIAVLIMGKGVLVYLPFLLLTNLPLQGWSILLIPGNVLLLLAAVLMYQIQRMRQKRGTQR